MDVFKAGGGQHASPVDKHKLHTFRLSAGEAGNGRLVTDLDILHIVGEPREEM